MDFRSDRESTATILLTRTSLLQVSGNADIVIEFGEREAGSPPDISLFQVQPPLRQQLRALRVLDFSRL